MLPENFSCISGKGESACTSSRTNPAPLYVSGGQSLDGGGDDLFFSLRLSPAVSDRSLSDVLPEWWGSRSTVVALLGLLVFVMALRATEWPTEGGGIIIKIG